jgi:hypothetical protein
VFPYLAVRPSWHILDHPNQPPCDLLQPPRRIVSPDGKLDSETFGRVLAERQESRGRKPQPWRYFIGEDELIYADGRTYAFDRMWGHRTQEAMELLLRHFKDKGIAFKRSDSTEYV